MLFLRKRGGGKGGRGGGGGGGGGRGRRGRGIIKKNVFLQVSECSTGQVPLVVTVAFQYSTFRGSFMETL